MITTTAKLHPARRLGSVQQRFVRLQGISGDVLCLGAPGNPAAYVGVLEVGGIAYDLHSQREQERLMDLWQQILAGCTFPLQLLWRSLPLRLDPYLQRFERATSRQEAASGVWETLASTHRQHVRALAARRTLVERRIYLLTRYTAEEQAHRGLKGLLWPGPPRQDAAAALEEARAALEVRLAQLSRHLERDRLLRHWAEALASVLALQETKAQMETFLGIVSHELKTPLTTIKLNLQLTERRLRAFARRQASSRTGEDDAVERFLEQLTSTLEQVDRLERLVDDLIDVSRVQAGKLELRLADTDLATIVRQAVEAQSSLTPERNISLQCPALRPVPVYADRVRVEQVVTNYLTNALKYSPVDRPVAVGVEVEAQRARVWVRDQGPGLSAEEQERIWERFYRAKGIEVQSGTGVGLGLGLHICRTIIECHQGQANVESTPGEGSTFWFTLPLSTPPDEDRESLMRR